MPRYLGSDLVLARRIGDQRVLRRYVGDALAYESVVDFRLGWLQTDFAYTRGGTAGNWVAGSGAPKWVQVAANAPRFAVDELDPAMRAVGLLFEPTIQNYAGFNRGTTRTGWVASNVTTSAVAGCDQTGTKALRLVATADGGTYTLATGMPAAAGVYVYSIRAKALADRSGAWALGKSGYGKVWIVLTHDSGQVEQRDISADLQAFLADEVTPAWVPVFVAAYCGASGLQSISVRIDEEGTGVEIDLAQLELSANGRGVPTSPISTEGVASASRAADQLTITLPGIGAVTVSGDDLWSGYDENDLAYRDVADWRDREQDCIATLAIAPAAGGAYAVTLTTADRNLPNSGFQQGQPSPITPERVYETDGSISGTYQDQLFPRGYTFGVTFA